MSHKSFISKIKPANTNAELKAQAIKGNLDQAQLARLADVNNLGEQSDEIFKGVVTHFEFSDPNSNFIAYHFHKTAETASLPAGAMGPGSPALELEGYYIAFNFGAVAVAPGSFAGREVARIVMENNPMDRLTVSKVEGVLGSSHTSLGYTLQSEGAFATGTEVFDSTSTAIPTTSASVFVSNEDATSPGSSLANQRRLLVSVTAGGSNTISFNGLVRVNFMVPKGTKITIVDV
jgi:hypothetical protein